MMRLRKLWPALLALAMLTWAGCNDDDDGGGGTDAGMDAGTDAGADAGADAGMDAGQDAGTDAGEDGGTGGVNALTVSDQTLALSTEVTVDEVESAVDGWVVIHEDDGSGSPGPVIGFEAVPAGSTTDLAVALDRPAEDGETLFPMLHVDLGEPGAYEFPGEDVPATDADGQVVVLPLVVTVGADTPAVRFTLGANGIQDYDLVSVEPAAYEGLAATPGLDPTLTLWEGWRYEVVNTVAVTHPFALLTFGADPTSDGVLASQSSDGSLEADPDLDWVEDGADTVRFTAAAALADTITGYRCQVHPAAMRGEIIVTAGP